MNQWIIISGACAPDMVPFEGDPRFARMAASGITDRLMALTLLAAVKRYFPPEP